MGEKDWIDDFYVMYEKFRKSGNFYNKNEYYYNKEYYYQSSDYSEKPKEEKISDSDCRTSSDDERQKALERLMQG